MDVEIIPALSDNYCYLLRAGAAVGVVDPADPVPVQAALDRHGLRLTHIFNTHHHADHIGGNRDLKARHGCIVIGPRADAAADRIPALDRAMGEGDTLAFGDQTLSALEIPGHTLGHVAFWFPAAAVVFTGDTLFALGCGRLFEGTAEQMWESLRRLRALPEATAVYCGHEYTQSNARFALTVEPGNPELQARADAIAERRAANLPTVPSTIGLERATNPFLRADLATVQAAVGLAGADPVTVFAELRRRKDSF